VRPDPAGTRRQRPPGWRLVTLALVCLALLPAAACGGDDGSLEQADAAREQYQEIRSRVADLEEFFPRMEERLSQDQGEGLKKSAGKLVEEGRRSYDAFLKSAAAARTALEELKSLGGKDEEYADSLLALLDANQAEAMLVAEAMLQVDEFVRQLPPASPAEFPPFAQVLDELAAGILESRDAVRSMEAAAEKLYQNL
jgi:hypothetical protein